MLHFDRVDKGVQEVISLHDLLQSVAEMVQVQSVFSGIELSFIGNSANDMVYADQDQLRQVLVNCLLNSADAVSSAGHGDDGYGRIILFTAQAAALAEGHRELICISIADNGIGVAGEDLAVIFDPFYTTKEPGKGTGLGLSVSLSIIESVGGRMEMKSQEGQGSVLTLLLPLYMGK
jgi:signal transduction histidine kinase